MSRLPHLVLVGIILAYIGLSFTMSHIANFNKGPDEETNLAYAEFLTSRGRLPVTYEERELIGKDSNWPALYHLIVANIGRTMGVDVENPPHIKIFWDSFRYRAIDGGEEWYYLRTEDQQWPYIGKILILHIGRWLSILFGVITLLLVYKVALVLRPNQPWLALAIVAVLAFLPTYNFMSSVMNEDTMMAAATTLYLWVFILIFKQPNQNYLYILLGLILGISVTIKYTTIILPLAVVITLGYLAWEQRFGWLWAAQRIAVVGVSTIIGSSWWFGWNFWFLNEVEERGWVTGLLRPIFTGGPDITLSRLGYYFSGGEIGLSAIPEGRIAGSFNEWVTKTFTSFWGMGISGAVPLSPYIYLFIFILLGLTMFGLWRLWRDDASSQRWLILLLVHIAVFFILPLLRFSLTRRIGETAQGRHILMPAAGAVVILIVWGLSRALPKTAYRWAMIATIAIFVFWTGAHIERLNRFVPETLPMRTTAQAAEWLPQSINAQFGEEIELVSYEITPQPDQGLLQVALAWRSLAHMNESYLEKITLLDPAGNVIAFWQGHHSDGRLPTLAWDPGDVIFDRLAVPLPDLSAGDYQLQIQLLSQSGPLPVTVNGGQTQDVLPLTNVTLDTPSNLPKPEQAVILADDLVSPIEINFALWQTVGPVETNQEAIYRYPSTISVITSPNIQVVVIDRAGQRWSATESIGQIHNFVIGPRWSSGEAQLELSLSENDGIIRQVTTGPLFFVDNWWERDFTLPEIESPLEANFADQIKLLGYKLSSAKVKAGEAFPITLYWQAPLNAAPQATFTQFNNFLDNSGKVRGGYERNPLEYYNTLLWAPGEVVVDGYAVPVDEDAPQGEYYLNVGYYLSVGESAVNLPLVVDGQMTDVSSVTIGPIQVVAP